MSTLTAKQVAELDPYRFLAVLGKRVIHPGGRESTDRLLEWAIPGHSVLDVGCGVVPRSGSPAKPAPTSPLPTSRH